MVQTIVKNELLILFSQYNKKTEYHTHTLRHTSATLLYNENNVDIFISMNERPKIKVYLNNNGSPFVTIKLNVISKR